MTAAARSEVVAVLAESAAADPAQCRMHLLLIQQQQKQQQQQQKQFSLQLSLS